LCQSPLSTKGTLPRSAVVNIYIKTKANVVIPYFSMCWLFEMYEYVSNHIQLTNTSLSWLVSKRFNSLTPLRSPNELQIHMSLLDRVFDVTCWNMDVTLWNVDITVYALSYGRNSLGSTRQNGRHPRSFGRHLLNCRCHPHSLSHWRRPVTSLTDDLL
jgi:hypothetical protein